MASTTHDLQMRMTQEVIISLGSISLRGTLQLPAESSGLILFAHGSGSSRFSPRNRFVAQVMHEAMLGTLLFDLLTPEEETIDLQTRHLRFDIPLLARRLVAVTGWIKNKPETSHLPLGYFGASTGAAAALIAAAELNDEICAVVSRGGRPDLADEALPQVTAPTLLIVGERDDIVIQLNEMALNQLRCVKQLQIIPGATHFFEEPGTLEKVAHLAATWFQRFLCPSR
ncbi:MAG: alpha/beta hydrolase [Acidobacteria bacterium]|nr:alpha/beta hydrolase [Acidobacteriota bacterium]